MTIEEAISKVRNIPYTPWIELSQGTEEAIKIVCELAEKQMGDEDDN